MVTYGLRLTKNDQNFNIVSFSMYIGIFSLKFR